jgi:hypothetical protein
VGTHRLALFERVAFEEERVAINVPRRFIEPELFQDGLALVEIAYSDLTWALVPM